METTRDDSVDSTPESTMAAAVSLPTFWPNRTELWFATAVARFDLAHPKIINEVTKFNHVLTVLSPEIADEVADLITNPDKREPYTKLKTAIIERTSLSESQKLKQLLAGQELGMRKPSQLLRHMRSLVHKSCNIKDEVLKELFLQQMPVDIRQILLSVTAVSLENLAEVADRIIENTPNVAAVSTKRDTTTPHAAAQASDAITVLTNKLDEVMKRLNDLERNHTYRRDRRRSSSRSRSRTHSKTPNTEANNTDCICWYHRKFGDKATKCTTPCGFAKPKNEEGQ